MQTLSLSDVRKKSVIITSWQETFFCSGKLHGLKGRYNIGNYQIIKFNLKIYSEK